LILFAAGKIDLDFVFNCLVYQIELFVGFEFDSYRLTVDCYLPLLFLFLRAVVLDFAILPPIVTVLLLIFCILFFLIPYLYIEFYCLDCFSYMIVIQYILTLTLADLYFFICWLFIFYSFILL